MTDTPAIEISHVTKTFSSGFTAIDDLSCTIPTGSMIGLLGPNGAGKTTLMHMLLGILTPSSGTISYFGQPLTTDAARRSAILQKIGYASSYIRLPGKLTVETNLLYYGSLYGQSPTHARARMDQLLKAFDLQALKTRTCYALSAGQATRLMLAKAFMGYPRVVLLDEPTASLDVEMVESVLYFVKQQQHTERTTIIFTSHKIDEVSRLCEKVLVLYGGKGVAYATPHELITQYAFSRIRVLSPLRSDIRTWAQQAGYEHAVQDEWVHIMVPESDIPHALAQFTQQIAHYDQISIEPPTLNDYFLRLSKHK